MTSRPLPIVDGSYADDSRPFSDQDTVNWLPVSAEQDGARSANMLRTPPGLREFARIGAGPHRGARNVEGTLFVVSGRLMYKVGTDGATTTIGVIPGRSRVSITHNQITGGNQVMVVNGSDGYVYNTFTDVFAKISDDGFPGGIVCDYINSIVVAIEPGRRFFFNSNLADATDYNTIERYESEASPDLLRSLIVSHLEMWLFNDRTIEVFDNTVDATSIANHILFVNKRIVIERGCSGAFTVCKLDNSIFWIGDDGVVYRANGYTPQRISTQAIERALAACDLSKAWMFTWTDRGFSVVYITCPDGHTWGYDVSIGKWHRRETYGYSRWRLNTLVEWNGAWYGGDNYGILYRLDWDYFLDGCNEMVSSRTSGVVHNNQKRLRTNSIELVFDTGSAVSTSSCLASQSVQIYAAGGNTGYVGTSPDAVTWTRRDPGVGAIQWQSAGNTSNGEIMFVGGGYTIFTKDLGVTWKSNTGIRDALLALDPTLTLLNSLRMLYSSDLGIHACVMTASHVGNPTPYYILTSADDGKTWKYRATINDIFDMAELNGVFIVNQYGGAIGTYRSIDGCVTWQLINGTGLLVSTSFAGKFYGMYANNNLYTMPFNGTAWTLLSTTAPASGFYGMGSVGTALFGYNHPGIGPLGIWRSLDKGVTWTQVYSGIVADFPGGIAFANSKIIVTSGTSGTGLKVSSDNGDTWVQANVPSMTVTTSATAYFRA